MIKRKLAIGGLSSLLVLGLATPVFAIESNSEPVTVFSFLKQTVDEVTGRASLAQEDVESTVDDETSTDDSFEQLREDRKSQLEQIRERRQALLEDYAERKDEVKERLKGARLAKCENREAKINELIDRGVNNSRKLLAAIQRVEEGVKNFYEKHELSSGEYEAAAQNTDDKETAAIAVIDAIGEQDFSCENVDGEKPARTLHDLHKQRRAALVEYRQSVKELMAVVRKALVEKVGE